MTDYAMPALTDLLTRDECELLAELGVRRAFADGTLIHQRGGGPAEMGVVVSGAVRLVRQLRDGRQLQVVTILPGQHYADITAIDGLPRTHHGIAVGPTVVDYYPPAAFARLLEVPGIVRALYRITALRLVQAVEIIDDIRALPPQVRLAKLLTVMQQSAGGASRIPCRQDELASMLGVSAMTLAKAIKSLRQLGFVQTGYRSVTVLDPAGFAAWVAEQSRD